MHAMIFVCEILCRPTMVKIWKMKSVSEFKPDPYVATVLNCMMWTFYGLPFVHPDSLLVITINGTGLFMELVYVTIFFIFASASVRVSFLIPQYKHACTIMFSFINHKVPNLRSIIRLASLVSYWSWKCSQLDLNYNVFDLYNVCIEDL